MAETEREMIRVEFKFNDGLIRYLDGKEAQRWYEALKALDTFCFVHGWRPPAYNWLETSANW